MKHCKKCNTTLSLDYFGKDKQSKDGKQAYCKDCRCKQRKSYYSANAPEVIAYQKAYYSEHKDHYKVVQRAYAVTNPHKIVEKAAKRRATKISATPHWLTEEHYTQIAYTYWLAKDLEAISGESYHVDHIVPLQGKNVCGLHVPWNLQVLPATENLKKSNTHHD